MSFGIMIIVVTLVGSFDGITVGKDVASFLLVGQSDEYRILIIE